MAKRLRAKGQSLTLHQMYAEMAAEMAAALGDEKTSDGPPLWTPHPGPQADAHACLADELFYGGAAGGGKSDLLLGLALTDHHDSIIFRREFTQFRGPGGMIERSKEIVGNPNLLNQGLFVWRNLPGRRSLEFGAVSLEEHKNRYKGRAHDFKGFDEITEFSESQYRFLITWLRTVRAGQRCRVVCTGNPPTTSEGQWVLKYWGPWLDDNHPKPAKSGELRYFAMVSGKEIEVPDATPLLVDGLTVIPRSRTFIQALVEDNPSLATTGYIQVLNSLPEPLRSQMRFGDFRAKAADDERQVIPTAWVVAAQERWLRGVEDEDEKSLGKMTPVHRMDTTGSESREAGIEAAKSEDAESLGNSRIGEKGGKTVPQERETLLSPATHDRMESLRKMRSAPRVEQESRVKSPITAVGVDPSRGGEDQFVVAIRRGMRLDPLLKHPAKSAYDGQAGLRLIILDLEGDYGAPVRIDIIGTAGASVYDQAKDANLLAVAMNASQASYARDTSGKLAFANKRAEWHWRMRELLDPANGHDVALPPDTQLRADLCATRWSVRAGKIYIESKDDVRKRIGRSPDCGDACLYAYATDTPYAELLLVTGAPTHVPTADEQQALDEQLRLRAGMAVQDAIARYGVFWPGSHT